MSKNATNTDEKTKKETSPERKAAKAAKNEQRKLAKNFLRQALAEYELPEEFKKALVLVIGSGSRAGAPAGTTGILGKLRDAFTKDKTIDELKLFQMFKIGRSEMNKHAKRLISKVEPAERLWISFDAASESWVLAGTGATPPKGWKGYIPSAKPEGDKAEKPAEASK